MINRFSRVNSILIITEHMKKVQKDIVIASLVLAALLVAGNGYAAMAQTTGSASTTDGRTQARMERVLNRANQEIDRRIARLNQVVSRLQEMRKISDAQKTAFIGPLQAQVAQLTALKAKVGAEMDLQALLADAQSITKSYRTFALIIPQAAIVAMADRTMAITDTVNALASKLQTRIGDAQTAGRDVSALQSLLTDLSAKTADANAQAQAAINAVQSLAPDQGDQAQFTANKQALVAARTKLQTARHDLQTARQDAGAIVRGLEGVEGGPGTVTTTTSTATSSQ